MTPTPRRTKVTYSSKSTLAGYFGILLRAHNIHLHFVREHKFHPKRQWRFDYADVQNKIAVEIDGGAFTQGRHGQGMGMVADREKCNAAIMLGWWVFHYCRRQDMSQFIEDYKQLTGINLDNGPQTLC